MISVVFLLEERSAKAMLQGLLPRLLPSEVDTTFLVFEGKRDLEQRLTQRIRGWQRPDSLFVVLRDKDAGDCHDVKRTLVELCERAGKPGTLVRVACPELESWYLGDLAAVERGLGVPGLAKQQEKRRYRDPDNGVAKPSHELSRLTEGRYQKVGGSRAIGPHLALEGNRSRSFRNFIDGVRRLVCSGD